MTYTYGEKKIVAVLAANLDQGVAMNVLGHMAVSLGAYFNDGLMGRPAMYDASGIKHVGIARYPLIVTKVRPARLKRLILEARQCSDLFLVDFPRAMLETGHDDQLATTLENTKENEIEYLGTLITGPTSTVTHLTGNFSLW